MRTNMLFYPLYYDIISLTSLIITRAFYLLLGFAENLIVIWDFKIQNSVRIIEGSDNRDSDNQGPTVHTDIHTYRHTYIHTYVRTYVCMYVCMYVHYYMHICMFTYVCAYVCLVSVCLCTWNMHVCGCANSLCTLILGCWQVSALNFGSSGKFIVSLICIR